ncbi:hypothetical protein TNCV_423171 [Trichonephila clavipes]|nr:hypothetical protein TNCV_423171 [Trichonephila clavipes]
MPEMWRNHITRDCPAKTKTRVTAYCINCNIYGHMANYRGCPSFPKPPKGAIKNNRTPTQIFTIAWLGQTSLMPKQQLEQITQLTPQMATREPGFSAQTETKNPNPQITDIIIITFKF